MWKKNKLVVVRHWREDLHWGDSAKENFSHYDAYIILFKFYVIK